MAIDSRDKRAATVGLLSPWRAILPTADTAVGELSDRQIVSFVYPGIIPIHVYVEPHRYIYWNGPPFLRQSNLRYLPLVAGVSDAVAVSGYTILYVDQNDNLKWVDENENEKIIVTSEGVITSTTTVSNTVTETTVYTEAVDANTLYAGRIIKVRMLGRYSTANGTATFAARLKIAGTTVRSIVSDAGVVTDAPFDIEYILTCRSAGASGTVWTYASAEFGNTSKSAADASATTVDTTGADDITLTIEWSAANAGNSVSIDQGFTELLG